ncbi:hypothetical protein GCM10023321_62900 [Pseudonocardia eucalypti]|uniref:Uncharacterized protein n=1 Tax=Pseudonocardia eucalypti TaxID=648755 RepID=A0ABP9QW48_9PSEU|nr:hypothetical protein [Pseudonocardia eucalypti]
MTQTLVPPATPPIGPVQPTEPTGPAGRAPRQAARTALIVFGAVLASAVAGALAGGFSAVAAYGFVGLVFALLLFTVAAVTPVFATYAYLCTLPLIAGIDRDTLLPLVRPNEALLVLLMAGACFGAYLRLVAGERIRPRFLPAVDVPLAVFLLLATVWPLASVTLRGRMPDVDELAAVLPMIKLVGIYFLVRYTVTNERRALVTVRCIVWPGAAVALIAVLQTLKFQPVLLLLQAFWNGGGADSTDQLSERGSATLGSPIAAGDVIIISLILVLCCGARGLLNGKERLGLALVLGAGTLASGQYSTWIAAAVAAVLLARRFPELRRQARRFAPLAGVAVVVGAPALIGRLSSFGVEGLPVPESWLGRYDNLTNLYLPHFNWITTLIGVSPNTVLQAPETWRSVVYLESGILYFLWIGGIPLLAAFIWLSVRVLRTIRPALWLPGPLGACISCLDVVWRFLLILTVIDPHLQLRGTGDLIFTLLGVTATGLLAREDSRRATPRPPFARLPPRDLTGLIPAQRKPVSRPLPR